MTFQPFLAPFESFLTLFCAIFNTIQAIQGHFWTILGKLCQNDPYVTPKWPRIDPKKWSKITENDPFSGPISASKIALVGLKKCLRNGKTKTVKNSVFGHLVHSVCPLHYFCSLEFECYNDSLTSKKKRCLQKNDEFRPVFQQPGIFSVHGPTACVCLASCKILHKTLSMPPTRGEGQQ